LASVAISAGPVHIAAGGMVALPALLRPQAAIAIPTTMTPMSDRMA
jgi:hypothetical protein